MVIQPYIAFYMVGLETSFVSLATLDADKAFLRAVIQAEETSGRTLPIESLAMMAALREQKRLGIDELALFVQQETPYTKQIAEMLIEQGFIEAHGQTRNRTYTLSANLYRAEGEDLAYTRQMGFDRLQQEQMILVHVKHHGSIKRAQAMELCWLTDEQAKYLLGILVSEGKLELKGEKRGAHYAFPES